MFPLFLASNKTVKLKILKTNINLLSMHILSIKNRVILINIVIFLFSLSQMLYGSSPYSPDEITVFKGKMPYHNNLYNWMWGKHYVDLYFLPIKAQSLIINNYDGGLVFDKNIDALSGNLFHNKEKDQYYLIKPLNSPSSFFQSSFFQNIYNKKLYKDTYLGNFIKEAVTIDNPFSFLIADNLASKIALNPNTGGLYQVVSQEGDTLLDSSNLPINNELVALLKLPDLDSVNFIAGIKPILKKIQNNSARIDQKAYIRSRIFDMLIGDWNKIPENWGWVTPLSADSSKTLIYTPVVLDRSHSFSKVDGVFFKRLLKMLGLSFITNYQSNIKDVKSFNRLGFPIDLALTANSTEEDWIREATNIQTILNDKFIDSVFVSLPNELQSQTFEIIKVNLKHRRDLLKLFTQDYYSKLQKTPIIVGTNADESFIVDTDSLGNLKIQMYRNREKFFDKTYQSNLTKKIWLYPMGGTNTLSINKNNSKVKLAVIGGGGDNTYNVVKSKGVEVYEKQSNGNKIDSLQYLQTIVVKDDSILKYDYTKYRYTKFNITPIGLYDSDLGFNIGSSISYTVYDLKRFPFTSQHQLSFDYSNGFTYQGIFPSYNPKKSFHLLAFVSAPSYFYNFFGYGNQTESYSDERKRYNRVHIEKYLITPAYYYQLNKYQELSIGTSLQAYKVRNPKGNNRYINTVYSNNDDIFKAKYYLDLNLSYTLKKDLNTWVTDFEVETQLGWNLNLNDLSRNYAYIGANLGFNVNLTKRLVLATELRGKALLSDKYTFYQAVTTELRGFRQNRFIGRQSFYQYTDLRFDMGRLNNPFTPLKYGVFVGVDHGRVWYSDENSKKWHVSYGGGFWLTIFRDMTGKFSYFSSSDERRFMFELGLAF